MPHQSPKVEYMPPALNTHQHHPSTPERYGCAHHEGSPTSREAQTRCLVLTDPGQQHQQRVTVDFILTVLTVSVPARVRDSWRRLYRQEHGVQLSQLAQRHFGSHLPICACEIRKKTLRFLLLLMRPGLRNNKFTYIPRAKVKLCCETHLALTPFPGSCALGNEPGYEACTGPPEAIGQAQLDVGGKAVNNSRAKRAVIFLDL